MRNPTLDVAKGLGIVLVVLGHNWMVFNSSGKLFNAIFSFHMPLFFCISGALWNPAAPFGNTLIHRTEALLKPYVVTLLLVSVPLAVSGELTLKYFVGVAYATGGSVPWQWAPLWFLPHLWLVSLACTGLHRITSVTWLRSNFARVLMVASVLVGGYYGMIAVKQITYALFDLPISEIGLPLGFDLIGITAAYYLIGNIFRNEIRHPCYSGWKVGLALTIFMAVHFLTNDTIDLNRRRYDDLVVCTVAALSGIYLLLAASDRMSKVDQLAPAIAYVGRGSLFILMFHFIVQNYAYNFVIYHLSNSHPLAGAVSFFFGIFPPLLMYECSLRSKLVRSLWSSTR